MKFQLEIAERLRTVDVQQEPQGYRVLVDGHPRRVDAIRVGEDSWSLIVRDEAGSISRSVEAVVLPQPGNGTVDVHIHGYRVPVHLRHGLGRRARDVGSAGRSGRAGSSAGPQKLVAPMPGKVVRVLVKAGDDVKARQGLVVVEAMKMENELRAVRDGRVYQVLVTEGQSVDAGTALVIVE